MFISAFVKLYQAHYLIFLAVQILTNDLLSII